MAYSDNNQVNVFKKRLNDWILDVGLQAMLLVHYSYILQVTTCKLHVGPKLERAGAATSGVYELKKRELKAEHVCFGNESIIFDFCMTL